MVPALLVADTAVMVWVDELLDELPQATSVAARAIAVATMASFNQQFPATKRYTATTIIITSSSAAGVGQADGAAAA